MCEQCSRISGDEMKQIAVVGAGAIGHLAAQELVRRGHSVTVISRSGVVRPGAGYRRARADAADPGALVAALTARGDGWSGHCDVVVNAMNPSSYTRWERDWPPMSDGLSEACAALGAGMVVVGNLYGYGRVESEIAETQAVLPGGVKGRVRAQMWERALKGHRAGRVPAVELRASDYFGADARTGTSLLMEYVVGPVSRGKRAWIPIGDVDAIHAWTYLPDIARLTADLVESDPAGPRWGRAWHVPTGEPRTMRAVADDVGRLVQAPRVVVRAVPRWIMRVALVHPLVRELEETRHQFEHPWILDSSAAQREFGWEATPWDLALRETLQLT